MNLLEERDYYKPFNYPWAFEMYKKQQQMHWMPEEVTMADDIKDKVSSMDEVNEVNVTVTFDPPWNPKMMSDEARSKLGFDPTPVPKTEPKIETEWE